MSHVRKKCDGNAHYTRNYDPAARLLVKIENRSKCALVVRFETTLSPGDPDKTTIEGAKGGGSVQHIPIEAHEVTKLTITCAKAGEGDHDHDCDFTVEIEDQ